MNPTTPPASFRADIEGLRAIAVLLVVACHAKLPGFTGGFVGVDVFFVISGYLITRLLHQEWTRQGRLDVAGFYARRLRRLLPAFGVMLLTVLGAVWLVYAPIEQPRMLGSAFSAALYFSNIHFAAESTDYLAPDAKLDPLLHTWSLGVEEQFYLAWPFLLLAGLVLGHRHHKPLQWPLLVLAGLTLLSFIGCVLLTMTRQPLAFFLPLTRAWEFGVGAIVALLSGWLGATGHAGLPSLRLTARRAEALALAGLGLIALPAALLTNHSTFPGMAAAIPVIGTALVILIAPLLPAGGIAGRLLGGRPLQWLGRLSYSWYLWHWPFLVIGRVILPEQTLLMDLALVAASLVVAQLSYALIEQPARESAWLQRKAIAFTAAGLLAATCVFTIQSAAANAMVEVESARFERLTAAQSDVPDVYSYNCDRWFYDARLVECKGGAQRGKKTAVLLGDSHAGQWFSAFHQIMQQQGWQLILITKSACPIIDKDFFYGRIGRIYTECTEWKKAAVRHVQAIKPDLVIVSNSENYPFNPQEWTEGVSRILAPLSAASQKLLVLRDSPNPGFSTPQCLARREWNSSFSWRACSFGLEGAQSPVVLRAYQTAAASHPNIGILDMTPFICAETPCQVTAAQVVKFRDANHLTDTFARALAPKLQQLLAASGIF